MSLLVTLTFERCDVGETGLKTGWVRYRHGAGMGAGGRAWGGNMVQCFSLARNFLSGQPITAPPPNPVMRKLIIRFFSHITVKMGEISFDLCI